MTADVRHKLHALIDHLDDDAAAKTLAYAQQLLVRQRTQPHAVSGIPAQPHTLPTLHQALAIATIDDLQAAIFGAQETAAAFDDTIRRWRKESESF